MLGHFSTSLSRASLLRRRGFWVVCQEAKLFKPTSDRIIVKRLDKEETTAGGIVLAEQSRRKQNRGIVVAMGPGRYNEELGQRVPIDGINVGDEVVFGDYSGAETKMGADTILFLSEREILAVVAGDD